MEEEIENRLLGLESIIHGMYHNLELMKYMSYNLHKDRFNLFNNLGLYWIWGLIMADQIIDFYKIIHKNEKFSFTKIINISKSFKCDINYELVEDKKTELKDEYDKTDFETVRSKYIAHQDLNMPEIKTDLTSISLFTEKAIELYHLFFEEFKKEKTNFSNDVINSFKEIFDEIDEYDKVKAFLMAAEIEGKDSIEISKLAEFIKEK